MTTPCTNSMQCYECACPFCDEQDNIEHARELGLMKHQDAHNRNRDMWEEEIVKHMPEPVLNF